MSIFVYFLNYYLFPFFFLFYLDYKKCSIDNAPLMIFSEPFTPYHQYAYSPYLSLDISTGSDKENLFSNQQLLQLVIISFILMTLMFDLRELLQGEIRCQSLLGVRKLRE